MQDRIVIEVQGRTGNRLFSPTNTVQAITGFPLTVQTESRITKLVKMKHLLILSDFVITAIQFCKFQEISYLH